MPHCVRGDGLADAGATAGVMASDSQGTGVDGPIREAAGEQPVLRSANAPVAAQDLQQSRRKHDVAVGMPLALLDAQHHALTVDVADLQAGRFRDPQAGGVGRHQDRAVLDATDGFKEARHFIRTENDRELARLL
ncbi:hypothetical protein D9M68_735600 [compost metagenome]